MDRRQGFNLLEVVVGAFIFSVAAIALIGIWGTHYRAVGKARHKLVANFLAESVIERALAEGFGGLPDNDTSTAQQAVSTNLNDQTIDVTYTITTVVERVGLINVTPPDRPDKLKKVSVTVEWTDTTGPSKVEIQTVVGSAD